MKNLGFVIVVFIAILQYKIWWGSSSLQKIGYLKKDIIEQQEQNRLFEEQNEVLQKEIIALKKNTIVVEEIAREKLGLIKPSETFYRIIPKENERQ